MRKCVLKPSVCFSGERFGFSAASIRVRLGSDISCVIHFQIFLPIRMMLEKGVAGIRTFTGGSTDASGYVAIWTGGCDPPLVFDSHHLVATTSPRPFVAPDANVAFATEPASKSAEDVRVPAKANLERTEFNSDLRPIGPFRTTLARSFVPCKASSAVVKSGKNVFTSKKLTSSSVKMKLTVSHGLASLAEYALFSRSGSFPLTNLACHVA